MANSHKRDTDARRKPRAVLIAGPLALLATASVVTVGVLTGSSKPDVPVADAASSTAASSGTHAASPTAPVRVLHSREVVSRSESRMAVQRQRQAALDAARAATERAVEHAHQRLWTTTLLNLWTTSGDDATEIGQIAAGQHVLVTGRKASGRVELALEGHSRWVTDGYLSADKPVAEPAPSARSAAPAAPSAPAGLSDAPCPDGSVENGLTSSAVYVYRSVCHAFPQITSYGGWDAHGEHASGKALDIMTSDKALGDQIAAYLQAHASELNLYDVIWWDRIWTPVRAAEGWRDYGNHGSPTANHMDHVHVSVN